MNRGIESLTWIIILSCLSSTVALKIISEPTSGSTRGGSFHDGPEYSGRANTASLQRSRCIRTMI